MMPNMSIKSSMNEDKNYDGYTTVHRVLQDFANGTSMHGIPRIINARSVLGRIFWSIICMGAFAIFIWQCTILLNRFYSYPKKVNMELVQKPVPFPAVTVCNTDFLHMVVADEISADIYNDSSRESNFSEFKKAYFDFWESTIVVAMQENSNKKGSESLFNMLSRAALVANVGPKLAASAGIHLEDFIVDCRFMDNKCKTSEAFQHVFDPYYFNCFTFRPEPQLENTRLQGVEYGLNLLLFSGSAGSVVSSDEEKFTFPGTQETYPALASGQGSRLVIHSPRTRPHPTANGFDIRPGSSVSVGVKARENVRIKHPHGNCSSGDDFANEAYNYTLGDCQNICIQENIMNSCGCVDNRIMLDIPNPDNLPFCLKLSKLEECSPATNSVATNPDPPTTDYCMKSIQQYNKTVTCRKAIYEQMTIRDPEAMARCECYPPCKDLIYDASYSLSIMPERSQAHTSFFVKIDDFFHGLPNDKKRFLIKKYGSLNSSELLEKIARVNIHISDSNIIKTTESPDYETIRLVSDIGGQLGLWIGISLMTIFEVLQLAADILRYLTTKGRYLSKMSHSDHQAKEMCNANGQKYIRPSYLDMDSCEIDKLTTV